MVITRIVNNIISSRPSGRIIPNNGAELQFYGRVREIENGKPIIALDYEYYKGMAEKELQTLGEKTMCEFSISKLDCIHRVGKIPVGEASLRVIIWSKHRLEALEAMAWFISQLKTDVPIWKNGDINNETQITTI